MADAWSRGRGAFWGKIPALTPKPTQTSFLNLQRLSWLGLQAGGREEEVGLRKLISFQVILLYTTICSFQKDAD